MARIFYKYFYTLWVLNSRFGIKTHHLFGRSLLQLLASILMLSQCSLLIGAEVLGLNLPPFSPMGKPGAFIASAIITFFGYQLTKRFLIEACGVSTDTGRSSRYHYNPPRAAKIGTVIFWIFVMLILPVSLGLWANGITSLSQIKLTD